jgi:hypothetical protein
MPSITKTYLSANFFFLIFLLKFVQFWQVNVYKKNFLRRCHSTKISYNVLRMVVVIMISLQLTNGLTKL